MSIENQIEEVKRKQKKLLFVLGDLVYRLYQLQAMRFVYTSDGIEEEKEINKMLRLLDYMRDRIKSFEEILARQSVTQDGDIEPDSAESASRDDEIETNSVSEIDVPEDKEGVAVSQKETIDDDLGLEIEEEEKHEDVLPELDDDVSQGASEPEAAVLSIGESEEEMTSEAVEEEVEESVSKVKSPQEEVPVALDEALDALLHATKFTVATQKKIFQQSIDSLKSSDEKERERGVRNIALLFDKDCVRKAYALMMNDQSVAVRLAVLKAVSRTRDNKNEALYRKGLYDAESKVRVQAIKGLSGLICQDSFSALEPMLEDKDSYVRGIAATCVGIYCGSQGMSRVLDLAHDESPYVRKSLVDMLAVVKPPKILPLLKKMLSDTDIEVKKSAEAALKKYSHSKKTGGNVDNKKRKR